MQNPCGRTLVLNIGGALLPGEGMKGYLRRVALTADISFRQAFAAHYGQYLSENTRQKLQKAAAHANHVSTRLETIAADLPSDLCREEIDTLRRLAHRLRGLNRGVGEEAYPEG